ncbi:hypothetical protein [Marisediminicola sp. LYQ134]|uniref:type IV pilus modification PilV family protein n=1 Tax=Marisediminicola sp. LYQ134 TaxID=3391061 RepID=UPI003982DF73
MHFQWGAADAALHFTFHHPTSDPRGLDRMTNTAATVTAARDDDGIGLIEIVVSMFVLAIIAIAFLPVLIEGIKQSAATTTLAAATRIVEDQLTEARAQSASCAAIQAFADQPVAETTDPRGVQLRGAREAGVCPEDLPGTIKFTASVSIDRDGGTAVLSSASTLILVDGE